jgi:hypothetical protein
MILYSCLILLYIQNKQLTQENKENYDTFFVNFFSTLTTTIFS